jgi:hypothetical protein
MQRRCPCAATRRDSLLNNPIIETYATCVNRRHHALVHVSQQNWHTIRNPGEERDTSRGGNEGIAGRLRLKRLLGREGDSGSTVHLVHPYYRHPNRLLKPQLASNKPFRLAWSINMERGRGIGKPNIDGTWTNALLGVAKHGRCVVNPVT